MASWFLSQDPRTQTSAWSDKDSRHKETEINHRMMQNIRQETENDNIQMQNDNKDTEMTPKCVS